MSEDKKEIFYFNGTSIYYNEPDGGAETQFIADKCLIVHATTADPASPVTGQIWFRSDL